MPSLPLHPSTLLPLSPPHHPPLPQILHTPSGLALIELQATLNLPPLHPDDINNTDATTPIGRFVFPSENDGGSGRVWLYVGNHQRMAGEIKKLPTPVGVVRLRKSGGGDGEKQEGGGEQELEIVDVVKYKVLFSNRPEPVGREEGIFDGLGNEGKGKKGKELVE